MLWLSQMACRDPNAGAAGAALERIAPLLEHSQRFLEQHPDSPRQAGAPLVLAMAIAATEVPQTVSRASETTAVTISSHPRGRSPLARAQSAASARDRPSRHRRRMS